MTTIQKTLIALALATLAGAGVYETNRATRLQQNLAAVQEREAILSERLEHLKSDNEDLANQLARENQIPAIGTARLRELLRLRGEVGLLRRRQRELEQALANAPKANQAGGQFVPVEQSARPTPFQMQLVMDGPGENSQSMTNISSGDREEILQVQKTPLLDYTAIRSASVSQNAASSAPAIDIEFSQEGQELLAAVTRENLNKRLAIVLDGQLFSAPVIRSEISGGKAQITGNFTQEQASELTARINDAIVSP